MVFHGSSSPTPLSLSCHTILSFPFSIMSLRPPLCFLLCSLFLVVVVVIFWLRHAACGALAPWPGFELTPPALEVWSLHHWTARKVPCFAHFDEGHCHAVTCPVDRPGDGDPGTASSQQPMGTRVLPAATCISLEVILPQGSPSPHCDCREPATSCLDSWGPKETKRDAGNCCQDVEAAESVILCLNFKEMNLRFHH